MSRLLLCLQALLLAGCATVHPHGASRPAAAARPAAEAVAALYAQQAPELPRGARPRTSDALLAETWSDGLAACGVDAFDRAAAHEPSPVLAPARAPQARPRPR